MSRLIEPNLESGANIDCCKLYRENKPVRTASVVPRPNSDAQPTHVGVREAGQGVN
jgi:hypothetical protein